MRYSPQGVSPLTPPGKPALFHQLCRVQTDLFLPGARGGVAELFEPGYTQTCRNWRPLLTARHHKFAWGALAALVALLPPVALAEEQRNLQVHHTSKVASFDIDGMRLYMTPEQVMAALRARFGRDIHLYVERKQSIFPDGRSYIASVSYEGRQYVSSAEFAEPTPGQAPQGPRAFMISMALRPNVDGGADYYDQLDAAVAAKFGAPDWRGGRLNDGPHMPDMWCTASVERGAPDWLDGWPCANYVPFMSSGRGALVIEDYALKRAPERYLSAHPEPSRAERPAL